MTKSDKKTTKNFKIRFETAKNKITNN